MTAQEAIALTQQLVRIDTTTGGGNEGAGLRFIASCFEALGGYRVTLNDRALVVTPLEPAARELLLLSGHVDTVTAKPDEWTHDPWGGEITADGKLWGRGSSDMKGGLGAQIAAMVQSGPTAAVALAVSTREEWGCAGSPDVLATLDQAGLHTDFEVAAMIVAEPTNGQIVLGHKGPLWLDITVRGVAAHGSMPELGESAITKAARLILRAESEMPRRQHPRLGADTLNVGMIRGGDMRNIVPSECLICADIRTVDDSTDIVRWWQEQPEVSDVTTVASFAPVWTEASHPWVRSLSQPAEETPVPYGTEAAPLGAGLGWPPSVIWGPGNTHVMHKADEYVETSAILNATRGYLAAI